MKRKPNTPAVKNDIEVQKPYVRRMIEEELNLVDRSSKLYNFIIGKKFATLTRKQKSLMKKQYAVMQKYYKILHERIDLEALTKNK